jgi:phosphoglycolate phosphatase
MREKHIFIFDLDGTLADAYKAIEKSLNYTRLNLGFKKIAFKKIKSAVGGGDKKFIESFFPDALRKKALRIYRTHHKKSLSIYTRLKPGAIALLRLLKKRGKILAIASNRPSKFSRIILKSTGIEKFFDFCLCADEINHLKPDPMILEVILRKFKIDKNSAVFIGDMAIDMETAKRAGIDAIFVKGGSSGVEEIRKFAKIKIIKNLKGVLNFYK